MAYLVGNMAFEVAFYAMWRSGCKLFETSPAWANAGLIQMPL
jgi:hypothetical protein